MLFFKYTFPVSLKPVLAWPIWLSWKSERKQNSSELPHSSKITLAGNTFNYLIINYLRNHCLHSPTKSNTHRWGCSSCSDRCSRLLPQNWRWFLNGNSDSFHLCPVFCWGWRVLQWVSVHQKHINTNTLICYLSK